VSDPVNPKLDRRALLLGAVFLVGGAVALSRFTRHPSKANGSSGPALSGEQFLLLEQVADTLIPATDTPGAIEAGVPAFVRDMLTDWASAATRADVIGVLDAIERLAWAQFGAAFLELPAERRLAVLRRFDEDAISRQDPAYSRFKYLVLVGYYQSESGATQELRYELVPGAWRSCLPLSEVGRASAV
jgi:glucoside 3-dehydrogenase (cytochrome c) hitch-hiker subunit